jgi:hypothetical protein
MGSPTGIRSPARFWRPVAAGVTGGILGGAFVLAGLPVAAAALCGLAGFLGASMFLGGRRQVVLGLPGRPTAEALAETVSRLRDQSSRMADQRRLLTHEGISSRLGAIGTLLDAIGDDLERHPEDLRAARRFLEYYPETTLRIVDRYIELSRHQSRSADLERTLAKVESILEMVEHAFRKELAHLLEDDVLDLDAEIDVLEKSISLQGFGGTHEPQ